MTAPLVENVGFSPGSSVQAGQVASKLFDSVPGRRNKGPQLVRKVPRRSDRQGLSTKGIHDDDDDRGFKGTKIEVLMTQYACDKDGQTTSGRMFVCIRSRENFGRSQGTFAWANPGEGTG